MTNCSKSSGAFRTCHKTGAHPSASAFPLRPSLHRAGPEPDTDHVFFSRRLRDFMWIISISHLNLQNENGSGIDQKTIFQSAKITTHKPKKIGDFGIVTPTFTIPGFGRSKLCLCSWKPWKQIGLAVAATVQLNIVVYRQMNRYRMIQIHSLIKFYIAAIIHIVVHSPSLFQKHERTKSKRIWENMSDMLPVWDLNNTNKNKRHQPFPARVSPVWSRNIHPGAQRCTATFVHVMPASRVVHHLADDPTVMARNTSYKYWNHRI